MNNHANFWNSFCDRMKISSHAVPLFNVNEKLEVSTKTIGKTNVRDVLRRSTEMDTMIRRQTSIVVVDWESGNHEYDGLIYMMCYKDAGRVTPLYIGKTEAFGKSSNLSENIKRLQSNTSKFARWGDNYAYHIGDLSAVVLGQDRKQKPKKYVDWATALFKQFPAKKPILKKQVYFWTTAWRKDRAGIWEEYGPTRLTFLEYLLIGVASSVFPDTLLNKEGQNRS